MADLFALMTPDPAGWSVPSITGNGGKFYFTDGVNKSWQHVFPDQTGQSGKVLSTNGSACTWVDAQSGPQGPEGPQGPAGPAGADGAQGLQGPPGAPGATGPKGDTGDAGPQGPAGSQGPQGTQGIQGPAGADGAQGPQGTQGPSGADGAAGPQGDTGPAGMAGSTTKIAGTVNNITSSYADVTGLSFPVTAGNLYWFKFVIPYNAGATTCGSSWSINGPAQTLLNYRTQNTLTATSETQHCLGAYNSGAANASSLSTGNLALIEGLVKPSANGTVIARFLSETSSGITVQAGAFVWYMAVP